ncbi:MAG: PLP-dependent aspartate aminotransferase family protein [Rhodospirillaceae bacterium]|nr:PLP-dependent aspartate aminotransferase family protein [Rhodospirillaceae bacterium]
MSTNTPIQTGLQTIAIHGGQSPDSATGAVIPPIYATSTYAQTAPGQHKGYEYSRSQNPTRAAFEAGLAAIEGGKAGFAFASGLAAENAVLDLLDHGSHIIVSEDVYGGSWRLFHRIRARTANLSLTHVDASDPAAIRAAITPQTRLIWVESPGNPLLRIADLAAIAAIAREQGILSVADNTFASPAVQRPLDFGFDIVVHSVTKYVGGHSDLIGGGVVVREDKDLIERLGFIQNATGAILDPFSSFLALRGLKTLPLRMERHAANAQILAEWLEGQSKVERVFYPGLPSHPQYDLAARQMRSGGGMLSFLLKGGDGAAARFFKPLSLFTLAESLGGIESLAGHPFTMSHASLPAERRASLGITPGLIRLSVGIEDAADLIADLERGLAVV